MLDCFQPCSERVGNEGFGVVNELLIVMMMLLLLLHLMDSCRKAIDSCAQLVMKACLLCHALFKRRHLFSHELLFMNEPLRNMFESFHLFKDKRKEGILKRLFTSFATVAITIACTAIWGLKFWVGCGTRWNWNGIVVT